MHTAQDYKSADAYLLAAMEKRRKEIEPVDLENLFDPILDEGVARWAIQAALDDGIRHGQNKYREGYRDGRRPFGFGSLPSENSPERAFIEAVGVPHDKDPVPEVRRADAGSRYTIPFRIIAARGQLFEYGSHPVGSRKEPWDVLQEQESWSYHASDSHEVKKESGSLAMNPLPLASDREIGAWETASYHIHRTEFFASQFSDVAELGDVDRPVLVEHLPAEVVDLDHPAAGPARAFEAKIETTDT